jgi:hypothetical protein
MMLAKIFTRLVGTLLLSLSLWGLGMALYPRTPAQADSPPLATAQPTTGDPITGLADTTPPVFTAPVLLAPADGLTVTTAWPTFDWADAADTESGLVSYTLALTGPTGATEFITTALSVYTATLPLANGPYTWSVRAYDAAGNASDFVSSATFAIEAVTWPVYLPVIIKPEPHPTCPTGSAAVFDLIPISGAPTDHPDYLHGDLNLSLRGYNPTNAFLGLVSYNGSTDPNAPQLAGLFEPSRFPGISSVYRVNNWNWVCGQHGCSGSAITNPPVTLAGLTTTPGESIFIPERSPNIYPGSFKAIVLYAEEQRLTLGYTREDTVANGYAVHIENICVDLNLLALYRAQTSADGWHNTGKLPALRHNQALGIALEAEILVAIRDRGAFMDPRSGKDWWPGY